jgi:hypothetical protein
MVRARIVLLLATAGLAVVPAAASAQQAVPCDQGERSYSKVRAAPKYEIAPQKIVELPSSADGAAVQRSTCASARPR